MARLANSEKMGFFATPPNVVELLARWIAAPVTRNTDTGKETVSPYRVFDPCAGEGAALHQVATLLGGEVTTWGVELSPNRAEKATAVLDKVLNTAFQSVRISHEAAALLYLNPPYDNDLDSAEKRLEIEFLRLSVPTLAYDGVMILIIPQPVLRFADMARLLAGHFTDIVIRRFPDGDYEIFKQVVVFARRRRYQTPTTERVAEIRQWADAELSPLGALPDDPQWPQMLPPAKASSVRFYRNDISDVEAVAMAYRQPWDNALLAAISAAPAQEFIPPMPLKKGHIAMLMSSGLLGTLRITMDGEPAFVKGRVVKRQVETIEETDSGEKCHVMRDKFVTSVGILGSDGVRLIQDDVPALTAFMETYGGQVANEVVKRPPRYDLKPTAAEWAHMGTLGKNRKPLPGQTEAGLLPVQKHIAIAMTRTLRSTPSVLVQGEMGIGKTTVGAAIVDALNAYPAIVLCPPQLVHKWARELAQVIPEVQVRELLRFGSTPDGDVNDARQFVADWRAGRLGSKAVAVISETTAKLGSGWQARAATRYGLPKVSQVRPRDPDLAEAWDDARERRAAFAAAAQDYRTARETLAELRAMGAEPATVETQRQRAAYLRRAALKLAIPYPVCPDCGSIPRNKNGDQLFAIHLEERPYRCTHPVSGWARDEDGRRLHDENGQPVWAWHTTDNTPQPVCGGTLFQHGAQHRRWPIADYIRRKCRGAFKLVIADEVHEYRGKGSDRGRAFHHLIGATRWHLALTGTTYGGKSTSVFHTFGRLFGGVYAEFQFDGELEWAKQYGVLETRVYGRPGSDDDVDFGSFNATKRNKVTVSELPGVSPAILPRIISTTSFLTLKDLGVTLPAYSEEAVLLEMADAQADQYRSMESNLRSRARQSSRWLSTWLQWSLNRPDAAFRAEEIIKEYREKVGRKSVVTETEHFMTLPPVVTDAELLPKEQWLVDYARAEKAAGRKVLVYVRQTGERDIQPRLRDLLQAAGLRTDILRSTVGTDRREAWINARADTLDVLICNPQLVKTGLDLIQFHTVVFFELDYDLFCLWQAMRRVWRLGQQKPVKVIFVAYTGTIEEQAVALMGKKMRAAQLLYGDEVGGAIVPESGDNFLMELARTVLEGETLPDLRALFAAAQATTDSPLGSPTAGSPTLPTPISLADLLSARHAAEALRVAQEKRGKPLTRQQRAVIVQEALGVQQAALF